MPHQMQNEKKKKEGRKGRNCGGKTHRMKQYYSQILKHKNVYYNFAYKRKMMEIPLKTSSLISLF